MRLLILMVVVVGLCADARKQRTTRAPIVIFDSSDDQYVNAYDSLNPDICKEDAPPEKRTPFCRLSKLGRMKMLRIAYLRNKALDSIVDYVKKLNRTVNMIISKNVMDRNTLPRSFGDVSTWQFKYHNRPEVGKEQNVTEFLKLQYATLKPSLMLIKEIMSPEDQAIIEGYSSGIQTTDFFPISVNIYPESKEQEAALDRFLELATAIMNEINPMFFRHS